MKHGECCYCRKCGKDHDECRCDLDDVVDELDAATARAVDYSRLYRLYEEATERARLAEYYWSVEVADRKAAEAEAAHLREQVRVLRGFLAALVDDCDLGRAIGSGIGVEWLQPRCETVLCATEGQGEE